MTSGPLTWGEPYELERGECLAFLRSAQLARVVLPGHEAGPAVVLPVNVVLDGEQMVLRTGEGVILAAARAGAWLTMQADSYTQHGVGRGWSVTAAGRAREATGGALDRLRELAPTPVAGGSRSHIVVVPIETVEGRRVGAPVPAAP